MVLDHPTRHLPYREFDVILTEIDERSVEGIARSCGSKNLSLCDFPNPAFPVRGLIVDPYMRYMIPLVCRLELPNPTNEPKPSISILFLVDTASPFTCLSQKSLNALCGTVNETFDENDMKIVRIQKRHHFECRVSKGHFSHVNILGTNVLSALELSIVVDWDERSFQLTES